MTMSNEEAPLARLSPSSPAAARREEGSRWWFQTSARAQQRRFMEFIDPVRQQRVKGTRCTRHVRYVNAPWSVWEVGPEVEPFNGGGGPVLICR